MRRWSGGGAGGGGLQWLAVVRFAASLRVLGGAWPEGGAIEAVRLSTCLGLPPSLSVLKSLGEHRGYRSVDGIFNPNKCYLQQF